MKNSKFFVRIVCIILCVLMVGGLITGALMTMASAATSSELKKELEKLKNEAQVLINDGIALQKEIDANSARTQTTIDQKASIDQQISNTEAEIRNANAQIQQYSLLISEKQSELEDAVDEQDEMNRRYQTRLRAMEENGRISYWSILFKANSFADLLSRIDSIREVAEADQRMLEELQKISEEIEQDRKELETELDAQKQVKTELAVMEETLQAQRAEADKLLVTLKDEHDALSEDYLENEKLKDAARQEVYKAQAAYEKKLSEEEAARLAAANKNNAAGGGSSSGGSVSGGFASPLPYLQVTCRYGWREHPIHHKKTFHHGVDLAAPQGTPIKAVAAGTVTTAAYGTANGYYVALSHGNGYGSLYAHMTNYTVAPGDYVNQGEVIGYVGSTGWSTGPHLHLEIHVNGGDVNPMEYIG